MSSIELPVYADGALNLCSSSDPSKTCPCSSGQKCKKCWPVTQ